MKASQKLQNKLQKYGTWALVTGASSGIGRELSLRLAQSGMNTILIARSTEKLELLKEEIQGKYQVESVTLATDLAGDFLPGIIDISKGKDIGIVVASAGFGTSGYFVNSSIHEEVNMLDINCKALLELTHFFANRFADQKRGGIILLSSMVAFQGVPFSANYAATKAYVQNLAEGLHHELKPHNVDVLAAAPGPVATGFAQRANMQMGNVLTPEQIAVPILKALGRKMTVLPGTLTKTLVYALRTTPRWAKIKIMEKVMGGMTAHQRTAN